MAREYEQRTIEVEKTVKEDIENKILTMLKLEEKVEREDGPWHDLPADILRLIEKLLSFKDRVSFAAVCQRWKSISPRIEDIVPFQLLMFQKRRGVCKFFDPLLHNSHFSITIPELIDNKVLCCKYGWLLLQGHKQIFFFNPFKKAKIELPNVPLPFANGENTEQKVDFNCATFTSPPTSSECLVFGLMDSPPGDIDFYTYRIGDEGWIFSSNSDDSLFHAAFTRPVFYDEHIFILGQDGMLAVYDLVDDSFGVITESKLDIDFNTQEYLMESNGALLSVYMSDFKKKIEVYKFDLDEGKWSKVESWEDPLFLDGVESKIYFPKFKAEPSSDQELPNIEAEASTDKELYWEYGESIWIQPSL